MQRTTSGIVAFALVVVLGLSPAGAFANVGELFAVFRNGSQISKINPLGGVTISSASITGIGAVQGAHGLASDPISGQMYALLRVGGVRQLATINPNTGVAALVGSLGDKFSALAFDSGGTLYGLTGDGAATPESLYTLSTTDATAAFVRTFGAGDNGETLAFNSTDGLLYHQSGRGGQNDTISGEIFESYNITTDVVSPITLSGYDYLEGLALTYDAANGVFLGSDLSREFFSITTGGVVTLLGIDVDSGIYKGLAFEVAPIPAPGAAVLAMMALPMIGWAKRRFA